MDLDCITSKCVHDGLKRDVTTTPVLRFFDQSKPVVIQTDASSTGIGSVLFQDEQPIAYSSRTLSNVTLSNVE